MRPHRFDRVKPTSPGVSLPVRRGEHDEQRCRVDRTVVTAERNLAERRHLAASRLVEDLAGLGVALGRVLGGLRGRQERPKNTARQLFGSSQSSSYAVMIPSRPNGVENHGTPAYGYKPSPVSVIIMSRSERDRSSHASKRSFVDEIVVRSRRGARGLRRVSPAIAVSRSPVASSPKLARSSIVVLSPGASLTTNVARVAVSCAGAGDITMRVVRATPSRPS